MKKSKTIITSKITIILLVLSVCVYIYSGCKRQNDNDGTITVNGDVTSSTQTGNGLTFKVYVKNNVSAYKGILVMGSGNNENNPTAGSLTGGSENALCLKAAQNGYVAAIVQYRKGTGTANWNASAEMMAADYNNCILALAEKYKVDKAKSVVGGVSYATFMLYTAIAYYNDLNYCAGLLGACGSTDADKISKFKIPVYAANCKGSSEGQDNVNTFAGYQLYQKILAVNTSANVKTNSGGLTDEACNTHCGNAWTEQLYAQLVKWLP